MICFIIKGETMSFNYNHITLVGRLTKDAEVKDISSTLRTTFTIAVDRSYRKDDGSHDTDFVPIVAWGRLGEIASQYLKKGNPVLIEGRLQVRQYEKESETRWISEVVVENFQLLGGHKSSFRSSQSEGQERAAEGDIDVDVA